MPDRNPTPSVLVCLLTCVLALGSCGGGGSDEASAGATGNGATGRSEKRGRATPRPGSTSAVLAYQSGKQFQLQGKYDEAVGEFQRAIQLDPEMAEAHLALAKARIHVSSQNVGSQVRDHDVLEDAIASIQKAIELEPNNDDHWYWVGRAYFLKNDMVGAAEALGKAVEINPDNAAALKSLGQVQKDAADTDGALESFQRALEARPRNAGLHFQLGQILELRDDLEGARRSYETAAEIDPTRLEVFGRISQVCAKLGDGEGEAKAREQMEFWEVYRQKIDRRKRLVRENPQSGDARRRLGEAYFEVGKTQTALEWFLMAVVANPKDEVAHLYCGVALRTLNKYDKALPHLKEAEFLAPDLIEPKLELLRLYSATGEKTSLEQGLRALEVMAATDADSLLALAEVCEELGREEDAARVRKAAAALGASKEG